MPKRLTPRSVIYQSSVAMYLYSYKGVADWEDSPFGATNIYMGAGRPWTRQVPMTARKLDGHVVTAYTWMSYLLEHMANTSIFTCLPIAASRYRTVDVSPEADLAITAYTRATREVGKVTRRLKKQPSVARHVAAQITKLRYKQDRKASLFDNDFKRAAYGQNYYWWGVDDEYTAALLNFGPICQEGFSAWTCKVAPTHYEPLGRLGDVYRSLIR